ncbi:MAG: 3-isopropylmalate dehydrogenase [candidate division WOR-3 bacterium]|nr:3-isopropylmalate dehydrogenase [candidate division WOR-3 bacterium]
MYKVAVLAGDGIGPEVIIEARKVLGKLSKKFALNFNFKEGLIGGAAIERTGLPLPPETLAICQNSDAVLLGAVGGPKWEKLDYAIRPERGLLQLRQKLGLFANIRPVKVFPELANASSLKKEVVEGIDLTIVRELTGGIYFGEPRGREDSPEGERGFDTMVYTSFEIERIGRLAFNYAHRRRKKLTSVDKANVLKTSELWRRVITKLASDYPDVELNHLYVDNCAMQLIRNPKQFDVIVTGNLFGDILSDEAAMLVGSIGLLPSASLGNKIGLYEPVHGSAPDIAGGNKANPLATILSTAMMLRYSFGLLREAEAIEIAVSKVLSDGYRTQDVYQSGMKLVGTCKMGDLVASAL